MSKYLIGSKLLGLKNNKDTDYLVLGEKEKDYAILENGIEYSYKTFEWINNQMKFQEYKKNKRFFLFNYQLDAKIIGQNFPIEYHILDYKNELIEYLNWIVENRKFNFSKKITVNKKCCAKKIYHIAYNMFILQNNSPILTNEQKEIVQKIHDKEMPVEYLDEMEKIIKSFKIESE